MAKGERRDQWIRPASGLVTRARSRDARLVAHVGRPRQRERGPRSVRPKGRVQVPPDKPFVHAPPRLADTGRGGVTTTAAPIALVAARHIAYALRSSTRATGSTTSTSIAVRGDGARGNWQSPAIVFVQDYHFALLPRFIRTRAPMPSSCPVLAHPGPTRSVPRLSVGCTRSCMDARQ